MLVNIKQDVLKLPIGPGSSVQIEVTALGGSTQTTELHLVPTDEKPSDETLVLSNAFSDQRVWSMDLDFGIALWVRTSGAVAVTWHWT